MQRKSFATKDCSVAQCLEVVGEWWSLLIVRDAFLGVTRFDDFQGHLGISRNVLRQRLTKLVDAGILERVPYSTRPPRSDYLLTERGRDLWPVLTTMRQWGDKYAAPAGPPVVLEHKGCGEATTVALICGGCGEPVTSRDVRIVAGPGRTADELLGSELAERVRARRAAARSEVSPAR